MSKAIRISLYLLLEKLKGPKKLRLIPTQEHDYLKVVAKCFFGYQVEITVRRLRYECTYDNPFFKRTEYLTYEVYSSVEEGAPENIKSAFKDRYHFPKMLPSWMPVKYHMERAVDSYLDMILQHGIRDQ